MLILVIRNKNKYNIDTKTVGIIELAKAAETEHQKKAVLKRLEAFTTASNKTINKVKRILKNK